MEVAVASSHDSRLTVEDSRRLEASSYGTKARKLYLGNNEVSNRYGLGVLQETTRSYLEAKRNAKLSGERFGCRGPIPKKVRVEDAFEIDTYTSSATGTLKQYETLPPNPDLRAIDRELLCRAEARRKKDLSEALKRFSLEQAARNAFKSKRRLNPLVALSSRCDDEYHDIIEMEAEEFKELALSFLDLTSGDRNVFMYVEQRARRILVDMEHSVALGLLAQLRNAIFRSEERLVLRGMGYYPYPPSLRNHRKKKGDDGENWQTVLLNVMHAAPLWSRVIAIRTETENEENILFLRLQLAERSQADLIEQSYFTFSNKTKGQLHYNGAQNTPPAYMHDTIQFCFSTEKLCIEADEETWRMNIADAALKDYQTFFRCMQKEEDELMGWLVEAYGSKKWAGKIKKMFAFIEEKKIGNKAKEIAPQK